MTTTESATVIASCTERDFLETILPYDRRGEWSCVYCGEAILFPEGSESVYLGPKRLECVVESLHGYRQLRPRHAAPGAANRCCSLAVSSVGKCPAQPVITRRARSRSPVRMSACSVVPAMSLKARISRKLTATSAAA